MKAHYSGYKVPRHTHCRMKCVGAMCQLSMRIGRSDTCGRVAILLKNCLHWGRTPFEYGKNVNSNVESFQHHFLIYMREFTIFISLSQSHGEYISVRIHCFMIHMLDALLNLRFIRKSIEISRTSRKFIWTIIVLQQCLLMINCLVMYTCIEKCD